ncbi:MAG: hypothetical protein ACI4RN_00510, partial [Oscillospiraceae bacterium]
EWDIRSSIGQAWKKCPDYIKATLFGDDLIDIRQKPTTSQFIKTVGGILKNDFSDIISKYYSKH